VRFVLLRLSLLPSFPRLNLRIELVPRITPLPTGLSGWFETFGFAFLDHLSAQEKKEVIEEVCAIVEVDLKHETGWVCMYVRLRFKAYKD
jgi:hypothetical protein